ncbi:hypothetical protein AB4037_23035 [Labrys sp. KB_33_2]|uniref:hypothetical protein n=1 Tax=Labrys sp. KB_33_2 TaxID=3237479 RepID=UPI003F906BAB
MTKSKSLTVRLSEETQARLEALKQITPYSISMTSIVERGIELAAQELEALAGASAQWVACRKVNGERP